MRYLILSVLILFASSCINKGNYLLQEKVSKTFENEKLTSNYYLTNRMPNCKKSVRFMKSVIVPDTSKTGLFYIDGKFTHLSNVYFSILGDDNNYNIDDLSRYYVSLDCLRNLELEEIFSILCSKKDSDLIKKVFNSERGNERYIFEVIVNNMLGFSLVIKNKRIIIMAWDTQIVL